MLLLLFVVIVVGGGLYFRGCFFVVVFLSGVLCVFVGFLCVFIWFVCCYCLTQNPIRQIFFIVDDGVISLAIHSLIYTFKYIY